MTTPTPRDLSVKDKFSLSKFLIKWEMVLIYIFILVNVVLIIGNPQTYNTTMIQWTIQEIMAKAFMVFGIVLILILGDIDVSIASTLAVSAMCMGLTANMGLPSYVVVLSGLIAGAICGAINGFLVAKLKLSSVIVTISTSLLFRGIVKIVMDNVEGKKLSTYPNWFTTAASGYIFGIPISLIVFLLFGIFFCVLLHKSKFGRKLYMMGNNYTASEYSGINASNTKLIVFMIAGIMAAVCSIFYIGHAGNQMNSAIAKGYELDVIAIAALGGVLPSGGKGKMYGPMIATFIMAFLDRMLSLLEVEENSKKVVTGIILIIAVIIPFFNKDFFDSVKLKLVYHNNKSLSALSMMHKEEMKGLKQQISSINAQTTLSRSEKQAKINKLQREIKNKETVYKEKYAAIFTEVKNRKAVK